MPASKTWGRVLRPLNRSPDRHYRAPTETTGGMGTWRCRAMSVLVENASGTPTGIPYRSLKGSSKKNVLALI